MTIVPTVDLGPWSSDDHAARTAVANDLDDACRRIGFLQVIGHAVAPRVIDDRVAATAAFFALPAQEKLRWTPPSPEVNRGYSGRGVEGLSYSVGLERPPDLFEAFNAGPDDAGDDDPAVAVERHRLFAPNIWPTVSATLRPSLVAYFAEVRRVAHVLTDVFAVALGLPEGTSAPSPRTPPTRCASCTTRRDRAITTRSTGRSAWVPTPTTASSPCCTPTPCPGCRSSAPTAAGTTWRLHRARCRRHRRRPPRRDSPRLRPFPGF